MYRVTPFPHASSCPSPAHKLSNQKGKKFSFQNLLRNWKRLEGLCFIFFLPCPWPVAFTSFLFSRFTDFFLLLVNSCWNILKILSFFCCEFPRKCWVGTCERHSCPYMWIKIVCWADTGTTSAFSPGEKICVYKFIKLRTALKQHLYFCIAQWTFNYYISSGLCWTECLLGGGFFFVVVLFSANTRNIFFKYNTIASWDIFSNIYSRPGFEKSLIWLQR